MTVLIGLIADVAQLDSLLTTGGGAVVQVIACVVIFISLCVLVIEKCRWSGRTITSWIAIALSLFFIPMSETVRHLRPNAG